MVKRATRSVIDLGAGIMGYCEYKFLESRGGGRLDTGLMNLVSETGHG